MLPSEGWAEHWAPSHVWELLPMLIPWGWREGRQLGMSWEMSMVTSHNSMVTSQNSMVTSHKSMVTSHKSVVTSYKSMVTSHTSMSHQTCL